MAYSRPGFVPRRSAACLLWVAGLGWACAAQADPGVAVNQYRAPAASSDAFSVARPEVGPHLQLEAGLSLDYGRNPLVYEALRGSAQSENVALVSDQLTAQLGVSLALIERLLVFASLPLHLVLAGEPLGRQPSATGFGAGDFGLGVRGALLRGEAGALALELNLTLPSGAGSDRGPAVAGSASATFLPVLIGELLIGPVRIGANAGLRVVEPVSLPGVRFANQLTYALAVSVPLGTERLRAHAEVFGSTLSSDIGLRQSSPLQVLLGMKLRPREQLAFGLAGGFGVLRGYGAPDLRMIGQFAWRTALAREAPPATIDEREPAMPEPEPEPSTPDPPPTAAIAPPLAAADADRDGVPDDADGCPALAAAEQPSGCPVQVAYSADTGALTLTPLPRFVRGAARLEPSSLAGLGNLAAALAANDRAKLLIAVHLDPSGRDVAALSRERARTLGVWLQERGVQAVQIEAYGCGGNRPLAAGRGSAALNERVDLALVQPLPRLGMPSTLRCEAVALPLGAAATPSPNERLQTSVSQPRSAEAYAGDAPADGGRRPFATNAAKARINLPLLDRAPRASVRSRRGCVSK